MNNCLNKLKKKIADRSSCHEPNDTYVMKFIKVFKFVRRLVKIVRHIFQKIYGS